MAMSAARCSTTSTPSVVATTCSGSRMSPSTTSAWPSRTACAERVGLVEPARGPVGVVEAEGPHVRAVGEQPLDDVRLPMKPSEPVTSTVLPATDPSMGRAVSSSVTAAFSSFVECRMPSGRAAPASSRVALGPGEVRGGADVDPVGADGPRRDDLVALEAGLDELRHGARPARSGSQASARGSTAYTAALMSKLRVGFSEIAGDAAAACSRRRRRAPRAGRCASPSSRSRRCGGGRRAGRWRRTRP